MRNTVDRVRREQGKEGERREGPLLGWRKCWYRCIFLQLPVLVPGRECAGASRGCSLGRVLHTCAEPATLPCAAVHLGRGGWVDLDLLSVHVPRLLFTSSWVPSSTLPQWALTLPVSDPERGTPCNLSVPGTPQHIPQPSGQGPSRPPPELQVRVAAGGREEGEREEGQLPQHV